MTDVIIIGAGCAGLTAAVYVLRAGLTAVVFEKEMYGGQIAITNEVENYPSIEKISGPELAQNIYRQAQKQGADIRFEEVLSVGLEGPVKTVVTSSGTHSARAVIIANGVQRRKLGCAGEKEYTGKGVSYCATCDGAFFRGKEVVVVGGGNTALEDALFLSNLCAKVTIIHRRDSFRGEKVLAQAIAQRANIAVLYQSAVREIIGEKFVSAVSVAGEGGAVSVIPASAVFVAIGLMPENSMFTALVRDKDGYFAADESCAAGIAGVYVAGDTRSKQLRQIVTAVSDGAMAAFQASNYLNTL